MVDNMTPEIEKLFNEAKPLSEIDQGALAECIVDALRADLPLDRHSGDSSSPEGYEAQNWDGSTPEIDGETIWVKELHCYPDCGCGGCHTRSVNYPIDGNRFHFDNK